MIKNPLYTLGFKKYRINRQSAHLGSNVCDLPIKPGPCKGHQPRFGFNSTTQQCTGFIYGGCRGNGNKFFTRELCEGNCTTGTIEATTPRSKHGQPNNT